jgi:hypothetical protein
MKTAVWTMSLILMSACGCGGSKRGNVEPLSTIQGNTVDVSFRTNGSTLPIFYYENAYFLLGEEGIEYQICLRNQAPVRIEAVLSVDGRDVVSGRRADYRVDRGYVLEQEEEICVEGFRESTQSVAAFTFTEAKDAYSAKMGDGSNIGVIGIAVFDEAEGASRPLVIANNGEDRAAAESPAPSSAGGASYESEKKSETIGTGYGQSVSSSAEIVPFVRRDKEQPTELQAVYYDNRQGLKDRGIRIPKDIEVSNPNPNPFPGVENNGFAPPPPR